MARFHGTSGDDFRFGTTGDDTFNMKQGGVDFVSADDGNDVFRFGASFAAGDGIIGGDGNDALLLAGDYSGGVALDGLVSVEEIRLAGAYDYSLTSNDVTVAAGARLTVNAASLAAGHALAFDGQTESDGRFTFYDSDGGDTLTGGAKNDRFVLTRGGVDTANGGAGKDTFQLGDNLRTHDAIDGGHGNHDKVLINGDYTGANALKFNATTMTNVETIRFGFGHSYDITVSNATVGGPNKALVVDGVYIGAGNSLTFDASHEQQGHYIFRDSQGNDTLIGGHGTDSFDLASGGINTVTGGGAFDLTSCGFGSDTLVYTAASDSTSTAFDAVISFNADVDKFDLPVAVANPAALSGSVSFATFDSDIAGIVGTNTAAVISVTAGSYSTQVLLFVEGGSTAGYQSSEDYIIGLYNQTGTLDSTDFI